MVRYDHGSTCGPTWDWCELSVIQSYEPPELLPIQCLQRNIWSVIIFVALALFRPTTHRKRYTGPTPTTYWKNRQHLYKQISRVPNDLQINILSNPHGLCKTILGSPRHLQKSIWSSFKGSHVIISGKALSDCNRSSIVISEPIAPSLHDTQVNHSAWRFSTLWSQCWLLVTWTVCDSLPYRWSSSIRS